MLIVKVKGNNIERALKDLKWKFKQTKVKEQLNERKEFVKDSVKKREQKQKAIYKQKKYGDE